MSLRLVLSMMASSSSYAPGSQTQALYNAETQVSPKKEPQECGSEENGLKVEARPVVIQEETVEPDPVETKKEPGVTKQEELPSMVLKLKRRARIEAQRKREEQRRQDARDKARDDALAAQRAYNASTQERLKRQKKRRLEARARWNEARAPRGTCKCTLSKIRKLQLTVYSFVAVGPEYLEDRPLNQRFPPNALADYFARVKFRMENPTAQDDFNRFKYGERWRLMVRVPLPENEIPHPRLLMLEKEKEEKKAAALVDMAAAHCFGCCNCQCNCLCKCGRLDKDWDATQPSTSK